MRGVTFYIFKWRGFHAWTVSLMATREKLSLVFLSLSLSLSVGNPKVKCLRFGSVVHDNGVWIQIILIFHDCGRFWLQMWIFFKPKNVYDLFSLVVFYFLGAVYFFNEQKGLLFAALDKKTRSILVGSLFNSVVLSNYNCNSRSIIETNSGSTFSRNYYCFNYII